MRGPRAVQLVLGPTQCHVEQAPFLVLGGHGRGPRDRHQAPLEPGDEHQLPLEALGPVEGDEVDAGRLVRRAGRRQIEPRDELGDAAATADGLQVFAPEFEERVAVLAGVVGAGQSAAASTISDSGSGSGSGSRSGRPRPAATSARCCENGRPGALRSDSRSSSRTARTVARAANRCPSPMRKGTPRLVNAVSNRDDCALVRKRTAMCCHGIPAACCCQHASAIAAASASSSA